MRIERNGASALALSHTRILRRLRRDMAALGEQIEVARAAGEPVSMTWLARQHRYQVLTSQLEQHILGFLRNAIDIVQSGKGAAATLAGRDAPKLAVLAIGPGPASAQAHVSGTFTQLPETVLDRILTRARDGGPLSRIFAQIAPKTMARVRDALGSGVVRGAPVREIAREVTQAAGTPLTRSLTIARTEILGSYRDIASETYQRSPVVTGWEWCAELSIRTCPVCWAMHGTRHSDAESLDTHVNCRCTQLPVTLSWADLGFKGIPDGRISLTPGSDAFRALSEGERLAVLGRTRLDAYNAGRMSLEDVVRPTRSERWGSGRRQATLEELGV